MGSGWMALTLQDALFVMWLCDMCHAFLLPICRVTARESVFFPLVKRQWMQQASTVAYKTRNLVRQTPVSNKIA